MRATDFPADLLVRLSRDAGFSDRAGPGHEGSRLPGRRFARASKSKVVFVAGRPTSLAPCHNASVNQVPMLIPTGEVAAGESACSRATTDQPGRNLPPVLGRCSVSIESIANARSKIDSASPACEHPSRPHIALPRDLVDERGST